MKLVAIVALLFLTACSSVRHNWTPILPKGCKQIAAEQYGGVAVLCEDGRIFY